MEKYLKNAPSFLAIFSAACFIWGVMFNFSYFQIIGVDLELLTFNDHVNTAISIIPKFFLSLLIPISLHMLYVFKIIGKDSILFTIGLNILLIGLTFQFILIICLSIILDYTSLLLSSIYFALWVGFFAIIRFALFFKMVLKYNFFIVLTFSVLFFVIAITVGAGTAHKQLEKADYNQKIETERLKFDNILILRTLQNGVLFVDNNRIKFIGSNTTLNLGEVRNKNDLNPRCLILRKCTKSLN